MDGLETTEKEFRVINEVDKNLNITQREISRQSGLSLGITNIVIKRLINKGYIKIKQLNKKRVQYFLTPEGFAEKAKRSYDYILKTIETLETIKLKTQDFILKEYKGGQRRFIIYGNGELANLVELSIRNLGKQDIVYIRTNSGNAALGDEMKNATVLLTDSNKSKNIKGIDVISMVA
jgi:DNA-binding MarR family transcriptional regulator